MYRALTPEHAGRQIITGWGLSILLHGALLVAVITVMPKMMVVVQKESFRWDVALVDRPQEQAPASPTVQESKPVPSPATPPAGLHARVETGSADHHTAGSNQRGSATGAAGSSSSHGNRSADRANRTGSRSGQLALTGDEADGNRHAQRVLGRGRSGTTTPIEQAVAQPVPSVTEAVREVSPVVSSQTSSESRQEETVVTHAPVAAPADSAPVVQRTETVSSTPAVTREVSPPVQEAGSPGVLSSGAPDCALDHTSDRRRRRTMVGWPIRCSDASSN